MRVPKQQQKPVFIGGFRSGTTLLINLLGMHEAVTPWFETKYLCDPLRWLRTITQPETTSFEASFFAFLTNREISPLDRDSVYASMCRHVNQTADQIEQRCPNGKAAHELYPIGADYINYTREQALEACLRWRDSLPKQPDAETLAFITGNLISELACLQTSTSNSLLWFNKTPEIIRFGSELRACLGNTKLILMIRDGREVARSGADLGWCDIETMAGFWKDMIELTRNATKEFPDDYLELRFEDLISAPVDTLDRVLNFTGLECTGAQIYDRYLQYFQYAPLSPKSRVETMSKDDRQKIEKVTGNLLRELGYL